MNTKPALVACALALGAACGSAPQQPDAPPVAPRPAPSADPAPAAPPAPRASGSVDCTPRESTIFSCAMPGGKRLAVCVTEAGVAEYRFGRDVPELTLQGGTWSNVAYSGGGEAQILFSNGDTDYLVFSRVVRTNFTPGEPNDPAIHDGVVVLRAGEVLATLLCAGGQAETPVRYDDAERALGRKEHVFLDE